MASARTTLQDLITSIIVILIGNRDHSLFRLTWTDSGGYGGCWLAWLEGLDGHVIVRFQNVDLTTCLTSLLSWLNGGGESKVLSANG